VEAIVATLQSALRNSFLRALSPGDYQLIAEYLVPVALPRRMNLIEENRVIEKVYFPESGLASIVALTPDREMIEVGAFGFEGSSNFVLNAGSDRIPLRTFMQIAGAGWQVDAIPYANAMHASDTFMSLVMRYEQYKALQFAYTALANGSYTIPERLARWVLVTQDRVGDEITITHDYLAMMLAVRRAGVTEGIQKLEGEKLIKATRGTIKITNRDGLLALSNGSYGVPEAFYQRHIGPMTRSSPVGTVAHQLGPERRLS
jgi:CRP-like cAMP-binding protein